MVHDTHFVGGYSLKYKFSTLMSLARDLKLKTVEDFGNFIVGGGLHEEELIKVLIAGLKSDYPDITDKDLIKEGGLFDLYMDDGHVYYDLGALLMQAMFDCGLFLKPENAKQVAGMENQSQLQLTDG